MKGKGEGMDLGVIKGKMENDYDQNTLYEILRESVEIFLKKKYPLMITSGSAFLKCSFHPHL